MMNRVIDSQGLYQIKGLYHQGGWVRDLRSRGKLEGAACTRDVRMDHRYIRSVNDSDAWAIRSSAKHLRDRTHPRTC